VGSVHRLAECELLTPDHLHELRLTDALKDTIHNYP
jgi:hypothetical protein